VPSVVATRVVTAAILIAAVLAALFLLPPWAFGVAILAVVTGAAFEWAKLIGFTGIAAWTLVAMTVVVGAALLLTATPLPHDGWPDLVVLVACGAATLFWLAVGTPSVLYDWQPRQSIARAATAWVVLVGTFVALVDMQARSPWFVLAAMAIVWIADTAAFFAGRRYGRHKLAPRISPGKSWEGVFGGMLAVGIYALLLVPLAGRLGVTRVDSASIIGWIAFVVVLTALSIVGDLHESLLKRRAGVKDSGTLLPGHGGVLDRTDALLAAMPAAALAAHVLLPA
jgi:phosphatidate cytidylyltransferase